MTTTTEYFTTYREMVARAACLYAAGFESECGPTTPTDGPKTGGAWVLTYEAPETTREHCYLCAISLKPRDGEAQLYTLPDSAHRWGNGPRVCERCHLKLSYLLSEFS